MAEKTKLDLYYHYSEKFGDIARNSAFVGLGVVWLFHVEAAGKFILPERLAFVAMLLVGYLATDVLHYFFKSMYWAFWASTPTTPENDVKRGGKIGMTTVMFLVIKFVFIFGAFVELGVYLNTHVGAMRIESPRLQQQAMQPGTRP